MKCLETVCKKKKSYFHICSEIAIVPAESNVGEIKELCAYFQYRAPNIDALQSPLVDIKYHEEIIKELFRTDDNNLFCSHNASTEEKLREMALSGNEICACCRRIFCKRMTQKSKRDPRRRESDLECFLRHLRNAIAHGHVFLIHEGNYIYLLFEDINPKRSITARIVCCQADLQKWKKCLNRYVRLSEVKDPNYK